MDPVVEKLMTGAQQQDPVVEKLMGGYRAQAEATAPETVKGIVDLVTGGNRNTPETRATPEVSNPMTGLGGTGHDLKIAAGLLATLDPQEQKKIIQENLPEAKIREDDKGNTFVNYKGKDYVLNKPGLSYQDTISGLAQILAFANTGIVQNIGKTALAKAGLGFVGGAGTSAALDYLANKSGADVSTPDAIIRAGVAGGLEAGMPLLAAGGRNAKALVTGARSIPADAQVANAAAMRESQAASKETGVELFPAQQTQVPSSLDKQAFLAELPGGSQIAMKALNRQSEQAYNATQTFINSIAPPRAVETGQARIRDAATKAIDAAKAIRRDAASPLYEKAFANAAKIDTRPVTDSLTAAINDFPKGGEINNTLRRVQNMINASDGNLKRLHNAKIEIDQMLAKTGDKGLGPTTKRELAIVQNNLLAQIDSQSPLYAEARKTFEQMSPAVNQLKDSILGKVSRLDDTQLKNVSRQILDSEQVNPEVVRNAKRAIQAVDPQAWNEITRVEIERRLGSIKTTQAGAQNVPGQIYRALFGNEKQTRILMEAIPDNAKPQARWLKMVLERASKGRPGGSQTASRQELREEIRGGVSGAIRKFLSIDITRPGATLAKVGDEAAIQRRAMALAKLAYDPSFKGDIQAIINMEKYANPSAAAKRMSALLEGIYRAGQVDLRSGGAATEAIRQSIPQYL